MPIVPPGAVDRLIPIGAGLLLVVGTLVMRPFGDLENAENVGPFLAGASIILAGFFLALRARSLPAPLIVAVAILARIVLLGQAPGPDIHRYVWEGRVLAAGHNPYIHAPNSKNLQTLRDPVWENVQHPTISAVYPPLAEVIFAGLATLNPSVGLFRITITLADLAIGALLWRRFGGSKTVFYLWNPLVLVSFAGGGHYDSFFLLPLVAAWLAWDRKNWLSTAVLLGAAVAIKWMALPVLAWTGWRILRERGWHPAVLAGGVSLLPFALSWLVMTVWTGEPSGNLFPKDFAQYARSADFFPRIMSVLWPESLYHNTWFLGPLVLTWAGTIFFCRRFTTAAETSSLATLLLSPVVHFWYFTWLVPFAVATRNAGTQWLTASAFVYFILSQRVGSNPPGQWLLTPLELAILWTPLIAGFFLTYRRTGGREGSAAESGTFHK